MSTVSILGCGWLGLELGKYLVNNGYILRGSTTRSEKLKTLESVGIQPFLLQVKPNQIVGDILGDFWQSDVLVINFPPGRGNPNVLTEHPQQLQQILSASASKAIIYTSSTGVYGDENLIATEKDTLHPTRDGTKAIAQIEQQLQQLEDTKVTILRLAGLVGGERQAGRFFAGKTNVSAPNKPVNMVHREDVIQIIHQVLVQEKWNEILNVCADEHPTKREFYTQQALKLGLEPPQFEKRKEEKVFEIVNNSKVKQELNYTFLYPDPMEF
jgi:nucleoside-diphosphate-sugar epimerase